jgi:CheY-like chemotaxis protein
MAKKDVLIVEDMLARIEWFKQIFIGYDIDYTHKVSIALELLEQNTYSTIFLDHDLCDDHYLCYLEGNTLTSELLEQSGTEVARWLGAHPTNNPAAKVVLHSLNEEGRKRMASLLKGRPVEDVPFTQLQKRLRIG